MTLLLREKNRPSVKAFSSIFDSKLIDSKIAPKKAFAELVSTQDVLSSKNISSASKEDFEIIRNDVLSIKSMLSGLMITSPEGLNVELGHTLPIQLMQSGFSSEIINSFSSNFSGLDNERDRFSFLRSISRKLVAPFAENIYETRVIAIIGGSGSGKTTLAAKIADLLRRICKV